MTVDDLIRWIQERALSVPDTATLLAELDPKMAEIGLPVVRVWHAFVLSHPLFEGTSWYLDGGEIEVRRLPLGFFANTPTASMGPAAFLARGEPYYREHRADGRSSHDLVNQLFDRGATDYIIFPIAATGAHADIATAHRQIVGGKQVHGLGLTAWAVRANATDGDAVFATLRRIDAAFALASRLLIERERTRTILHTYLGADSGDRVHEGRIRRGDRTTIPAAIAFTDLRDFSGTSERHAPDDVIDLLNDAFDCQVAEIEAQGGHVLAFLGDGLLAIWPDADGEDACDHALAAAHAIEERVEARNAARAEAGKVLSIHYGIALHWGEVFYGNIGAPHRMAFTVIGPAVNRAARLEGLGAKLGIKPILSDAFAARTQAPCVLVGTHEAKGVGPVEVWTLAEDAE